jgi:hypothetical protein
METMFRTTKRLDARTNLHKGCLSSVILIEAERTNRADNKNSAKTKGSHGQWGEKSKIRANAHSKITILGTMRKCHKRIKRAIRQPGGEWAFLNESSSDK